MLHEMKLKSQPFAQMKAGKKRVELRLYDEKRRKVKAGDTLRFTEIETGETLLAQVTAVKTFASFQALYAAYDKIELGYEQGEPADPKDMEQYYAPEEIARYGAVGIELLVLGVYRHFKGGRYEVIALATHSETEETMVVYKALYGEGQVWVRPLKMWTETVVFEGKTVPRFALEE